MDSSAVIPIIFWSNSQPTFRISSICVTPNREKLLTGSYTGQLCLWNLNLDKCKIALQNLLIGHQHCVTCLVSTNEFAISSCESGIICRWDLRDGYCTKNNRSKFIHRHMQLFKKSDHNDELLLACGDYSEIFILHSFTLQVVFKLCSKNSFDWISNFHVISSKINNSDIVSGITINGHITLWTINELINDSQYEISFKALQVQNAVDIKYNISYSDLLVVSEKCWFVFDAKLLNCMCSVKASNKERLLGGNFWDFYIVVWTNAGKFYKYNVNEYQPILENIISDECNTSLFDPAMNIFKTLENIFLLKGDSAGKVNIWKINSGKMESCTTVSATIKDHWISVEKSFFNCFLHFSTITCSIYILELDKFIVGCLDGTISCISAVQSVMSFYFHETNQKPPVDTLVGHNGKVNCLLYPHEKYSHFNKAHLVSGGSDFSVCLWDVIKWELLYKFSVQSGQILQLIVPPKDCSFHIKHSICSVSSDHSVAILNLKDKKCEILTSRHEFPVVMVHWKPLDDFIIVECFDGKVYVWQMETGHLDRVFDGVTAQEVIYACDEPVSSASDWNFYIHEHERINLFQQLCHTQNVMKRSDCPFLLHKISTGENSDSHIFVCNLEYFTTQFSSDFDIKPEILNCAINQKIYLLTQAFTADLPKKLSMPIEKIKQETEIFHNESSNEKKSELDFGTNKNNFIFNDTTLQMVRFFLSSVHIWGIDLSLDELLTTELGVLKPDTPPFSGVYSSHGFYNLFFYNNSNACKNSSSLVAVNCIAAMVLGKILELFSVDRSNQKETDQITLKDCWRKLCSFYELICSNSNNEMIIPRPKFEIFAKSWQTSCLTLRNLIQKLLSSYLHSLSEKENTDLLEFWYKYLPHFKIIDKTLQEKTDFENVDLKTVALVLFGTVGSDLKFKANDFTSQEKYIYQTCASFVYLLLLPNKQCRFDVLQTMAIYFLGRGYIVWEQFLKMEKIIPILLQICASKVNSEQHLELLNKRITAHNALKSVAIARTAAFIQYLTNEINQTKLGSPHPLRSNFFIENFKPEILSVLNFLLERTPYIMILYLNDVISLLVYCIDFSHLKQENLVKLIPVMQKFRQVHHSVVSQKIAVGLATGSLVLHDLRTGKAHEVSAHKDSVSALKFSKDGKSLVSYSCYENRISFWQVISGIFGLGNVNVKCTKSCQTYQIHDEEIRNHMEIASLTWTDKKSVVLSLCDGTDTVFHF